MYLKNTVLVLLSCLFVLGACEYNAPLTTEHSIPIDHTILGAWKITSINIKEDEALVRIFKFSDTEYAIHYQEDGGNLYFRAYPINIGEVPAVQLELIGNGGGQIASDENDRYHVASYKLVDDLLMISLLNSELISDELPDSTSLREAFIQNKDNPDLFNDPGIFRRIEN